MEIAATSKKKSNHTFYVRWKKCRQSATYKNSAAYLIFTAAGFHIPSPTPGPHTNLNGKCSDFGDYLEKVTKYNSKYLNHEVFPKLQFL